MTQIEQWLREEGMKEGERIGKREAKRETARAALLEGLEPPVVAKITGLPLETVQKLKNEIVS